MGAALGQNVGQIRSNVVKKVKKRVLSIIFFHILHCGYPLMQKEVVVQRPEWKFKANISRNVTFEGHWANFLPNLGQKCQKTDYFQEFHFS